MAHSKYIVRNGAGSTPFCAKALCDRRLVKSRKWKISDKWRSPTNEKPEISRYLSENTKKGDFNQQRTLSGSFFIILECLGSIRAVVLVFTVNKQTNTLNYIYIIIIIIRVHHVQKHTRAILPHAALSFITKLHCKNKNQVW